MARSRGMRARYAARLPLWLGSITPLILSCGQVRGYATRIVQLLTEGPTAERGDPEFDFAAVKATILKECDSTPAIRIRIRILRLEASCASLWFLTACCCLLGHFQWLAKALRLLLALELRPDAVP